MEITRLKLEGCYKITLTPLNDERGFFMRTFDELLFKKKYLNYKWVQENHSRSIKKNILRGLHLQIPPHSETKLIRCVTGAIIDVFVDLRLNSSTFGQWDSIELNSKNNTMVLIPRGFAHGYCTLTDKTDVVYKVDNYYSKENEVGIIWNDQDINIDWPIKNPIVSRKDQQNYTIKKFNKIYNGINI